MRMIGALSAETVLFAHNKTGAVLFTTATGGSHHLCFCNYCSGSHHKRDKNCSSQLHFTPPSTASVGPTIICIVDQVSAFGRFR
jgi:hypothetical protein